MLLFMFMLHFKSSEKIPETCDKDAPCSIAGSVCVGNYCLCPYGYARLQRKCVEGLQILNDSNNNILIYYKFCSVPAILQSVCQADNDCTSWIPFSRCQNEVCACQQGYLRDGDVCVKPGNCTGHLMFHLIYEKYFSDTIKGSCTNNAQCALTIGNSVCSSGKCVCPPGYLLDGSVCWIGG